MVAASRESLLLRGTLDLCVLALLEQRPTYGYEVAAELRGKGLNVAAGSVYPLLARLEAAGEVRAEERPSPSGPPRKWWSLTAAGTATLADGRLSWAAVAGAVDTILLGTDTHERRTT